MSRWPRLETGLAGLRREWLLVAWSRQHRITGENCTLGGRVSSLRPPEALRPLTEESSYTAGERSEAELGMLAHPKSLARGCSRCDSDDQPIDRRRRQLVAKDLIALLEAFV